MKEVQPRFKIAEDLVARVEQPLFAGEGLFCWVTPFVEDVDLDHPS
jgi:hypothetical protein